LTVALHPNGTVTLTSMDGVASVPVSVVMRQLTDNSPCCVDTVAATAERFDTARMLAGSGGAMTTST